jgi:hypothetical protein
MNKMAFYLMASLLAGAAIAADTTKWLDATPANLPRWRGFNLLEKCDKSAKWSNGPYHEDDFRLIARLGFNFVRLPMDYRVWIVDGDWNRFNEDMLREIDQAVGWGGQYGVHVCLNFHRAPGYTVASPKEATDLWTNPDTLAVCARHWAMFAKRYKGIPGSRLSFNLLNEPSGIDAETYRRVVKTLVEAIRAEDPDRLIIADGLDWGLKPCMNLKELGVAQATRGYTPSQVSHYKADWGGYKGPWAKPVWPRPLAYGGLYAPAKPELHAPLVITGPFATDSQLRIRVGTVSDRDSLVIKADGQDILRHDFVCGSGTGEWKTVVFKKEWNAYQNIYDRDYTAVIPAGTARVTLELTSGDWVMLTEIGITPADGRERRLTMDTDWGNKPAPLVFRPDDPANPFGVAEWEDADWLWRTVITPWTAARATGIGVMVGEWGCYNKTPHDVVLAWAEDCLKNWQKADFGWALWNFRGAFGVLDSERTDVKYENFEGHKLDRKLLDLLQRY